MLLFELRRFFNVRGIVGRVKRLRGILGSFIEAFVKHVTGIWKEGRAALCGMETFVVKFA